MKYIRTKDKILPYYDESKTGKLDVVLQVFDGIRNDKVNETFDEIVLKQANTIEELCDEFVVIYANGYVNQFKANTMANEVQTTNDFVKQAYVRFCKESPNYEKVFGAIWTDKGLIFVAKMNDKGELELL